MGGLEYQLLMVKLLTLTTRLVDLSKISRIDRAPVQPSLLSDHPRLCGVSDGCGAFGFRRTHPWCDATRLTDGHVQFSTPLQARGVRGGAERARRCERASWKRSAQRAQWMVCSFSLSLLFGCSSSGGGSFSAILRERGNILSLFSLSPILLLS